MNQILPSSLKNIHADLYIGLTGKISAYLEIYLEGRFRSPLKYTVGLIYE